MPLPKGDVHNKKEIVQVRVLEHLLAATRFANNSGTLRGILSGRYFARPGRRKREAAGRAGPDVRVGADDEGEKD